MQTFLTTSNFATTAQHLDNKRLNKQALEAWQIMMTNLCLNPAGEHRQPKGWYNHPASRMWRGYETTLMEYIDAMCTEWVARGYKTTIADKAHATLQIALDRQLTPTTKITPTWFDQLPEITVTHRTALLCKNYDHYHQFGWSEDTGTAPADYEYIWAVK